MRSSFVFLFLLCILQGVAQNPGGGRPGGPGMTGRVYGKIQAAGTNESIEYAVIQIFKIQQDTSQAPVIINGGISAANGDFSIDKIPVGEKLDFKVSFVGFIGYEMQFQLDPPKTMGAPEKDLGNIKMKLSTELGEVTIDGSDPSYRIEFDKRIYDVEKNQMNSGGTAEDVLRNVPALQVDMEGNVTMRNAAPQIFIDGRPTTLTIDQIPADAIKSVEVISNPSAKYDASGGGGGIINIVMKHNRGLGYNGSVRAGVDTRPRANGGLDLNIREGKLNFFTSLNYNQRKSLSIGSTQRTSYVNAPATYLDQTQKSTNLGFFVSGRLGFDWFVDNRNTFTVSQSINRGQFSPVDEMQARTDTLLDGTSTYPSSSYDRYSDTQRTMRNMGSSLLYKHLFAKEGTELTADLNYNSIKTDFDGDYINTYSESVQSKQRQSGGGGQQVFTSQVDYTSKINDKTKFEAGARGSVRYFESLYSNYRYNAQTDQYEELNSQLVNYEFLDQVYAVYSTLSKDLGTWKYQAGLRLESSNYAGNLRDTTVSFSNSYPLSLFPSLYITKVINDKQDVQIAMSRKINRPSFRQMIPFVDYSDSLNVSKGNPSLRPEFTHLLELSYMYNINKQNTFIASAYGRYTTNITVRNQITEYVDVLDANVVINTYDNASSSTAFGLELVSRNTITKWFELSTNLNLYQSSIDGTNISSDLKNNVSSFWFKTNAIIKLPKSFTFQALFDYSSRKALDVGSSERGGGGGGGGGMGGGGWGGSNNTVQGYVRPTYGLDLSLKKEFTKAKNLTMTLSMQDVMKSRINYTHSETGLFIQDTFSRRDWQLLRLQVSWKFGKVDSSLFKRRNNRMNSEGMDAG